MNIVNKYIIKDNITKDDIIKELKEKKLPMSEYGAYINKKAKFCTYKNLVDDIDVCIAFPEDLSDWDDFDFVLVLDDAFGQPYNPFYMADEDKNYRFPFVLNVIGEYNKFMDSLSFLERKMKTIYVTIPRMSSKRLSITEYALQKQREGYTVVIHDIGGQDVVLKPKIPREITKEEFTKAYLRYR